MGNAAAKLRSEIKAQILEQLDKKDAEYQKKFNGFASSYIENGGSESLKVISQIIVNDLYNLSEFPTFKPWLRTRVKKYMLEMDVEMNYKHVETILFECIHEIIEDFRKVIYSMDETAIYNMIAKEGWDEFSFV